MSQTVDQEPDLFADAPVAVSAGDVVVESTEPPPPPEAPSLAPLPDDHLPITAFAERAYLAYAMSVVRGRALPQVEDGLKPVQRYPLHHAPHASGARCQAGEVGPGGGGRDG